MSKAVKDAKQNVPVVTATLQGSIRIQPSEIKGEDVDGLWGSFDVNYALAVEMGNPKLVPSGGDDQREKFPDIGRGIRTGNTGYTRVSETAGGQRVPEAEGADPGRAPAKLI